MSGPVRAETLHHGAVERLWLARPKANVLDTPMILALREALDALRGRTGLKLIIFEGEGPHFSYGASVEEHLPERVGAMLPTFHDLFRHIEGLGVPTAAVVRGQCLGGGAELAIWCGNLWAECNAHIGFPEATLGVFPPVAALALPWRVRGPEATRLVMTGRTLTGEEATLCGLVDVCAHDPGLALERWYQEHLAPIPALAVRMAWRAARRPLVRALDDDLPALEHLYLEQLMAHPDATEGIRAFLERRPPRWSEP